jgi:signal transduction histidine kinase
MKKIFVIAIFFLLPVLSNAQQTRVDSVLQIISRTNSNVLDSVTFTLIQEILSRTILTDEQIKKIEKVGLRLNPVRQKNLLYSISLAILESLQRNTPDKLLEYGRSKIEELDQLNTPYASFVKGVILNNLRFPFLNENKTEEGIKYYIQKLNTYTNTNDSICIDQCYYALSRLYDNSGLTDLAIYYLKKSSAYIDTVENNSHWVSNLILMGSYYFKKGNMAESIRYSTIAYKKRRKSGQGFIYQAMHIAEAMLFTNQLDSVAYYLSKAKEEPRLIQLKWPQAMAPLLQLEALYKIHTGALDEAETLLKQCWQLVNDNNLVVKEQYGTIGPDYYLALIRIKQNKLDEAISLLLQDIERIKDVRLEILRDYRLVAELYSRLGKFEKSAETYVVYNNKLDSLVAEQDKYRSFNFDSEQKVNEKERDIENLKSQNKITSLTRNFSIGIAVLLLLLVAGVYYRFQSKKKANKVLKDTLDELKATQSQLIQSEKMASLGELTAGIAHEIQNPLNFVNNFSEVNKEMLAELREEIEKKNFDEVSSIARDVEENEEKIIFHGKRADAIVKGMLQHSRSSNGIKELTDINALCDEYLRLSYHGIRARDKSFNATMKTDFDESIGNINIIPQDIGRVVLNLINNAFYVVDEKKKQIGDGYEPAVSVSTKKYNGKVEIKVSDNGNGIPQKVLDKIFQPFFTTKPTGQGTGLGLSLSYDIVKAHGGELKVETKEGEGSEFIIQLSAT